MLTPRPYQADAIEATVNAWVKGLLRVAIVLATGLGKTVVFSWICRYWHEMVPTGYGSQIVILVHRDELVRQAVEKLHNVAPHLTVGIVQGAIKQATADVVVASVQTLMTKRNEPLLAALAANTGLVIVDECHHSVAAGYLRVLKGLGCMNGEALTLGVTATMNRADKLSLGHVWQEVVFERDILWGIKHKFLVDVKGYGITAEDFDTSKIRKTAGDFNEHDMGEALANSTAIELLAKKWHEHAEGKRGLVFTPTVDTAVLTSQILSDYGIHTLSLDGKTPTAERRAMLIKLMNGQIQGVANCAVLTEGADIPAVEVIALLRATQSETMYVQMVGRGLRPYPGKDRCIVLDLAGNAARHSLCGLTTLKGQEIYDTESLLEAAERIEEEEAAALDAIEEHGEALGPEPGILSLEQSETRELDLFGRSRQAWLQTRAGFWFIPIRNKKKQSLYATIVPNEIPGTFNVGWYGARGGGGVIEENISSLETAMSWAEQWAETHGSQTLSRKRKDSASYSSLQRAVSFGMPVVPGMHYAAGEVADAIEVAQASSLIDARTMAWLYQRGRTSY